MPEQQGLAAINQAHLGDIAYERIADAIVSGAFRPGEKLVISNLAALFEISSTPVRDAVKRLLLEGALEQRSPRDIRVPVITPQRYHEIADIRVELEGLAAARAAERRSDDDLQTLKDNIDENQKAITAQDWQRAIGLNKEFHFTLARISEMPTLLSILSGLWLQIGPPISAFYAFGGSAMIDWHYAILDAVRDRDAVAAREHMVRDIADSVANIIAHLDAAPENEDKE